MSEPTIIEERSWYQNGYVVVTRERGLGTGIWDKLPYRRFSIPWKGRRVYTPWTMRLARHPVAYWMVQPGGRRRFTCHEDALAVAHVTGGRVVAYNQSSKILVGACDG